MTNKIIQFHDDSGDLVPVKAVDNGDGTYSLSVDAALEASSLTIGEVDQGTGGASAWLTAESLVTVDNDFTGIITVTTSGVPVSGGNVPSSRGFYLKGHPDNTDTVWFMPDGRTKANGYPLNPNYVTQVQILNLNLLDFDSDVNGGKICWQKS
jgi:hypothetical protein